MRVVVARPAHERDARDDRPVAVAADDLLGPEPVLDREIVASGNRPSSAAAASSRPVALVATIATSSGGQLSRIGRRVDTPREVGAPVTVSPSLSSARACSGRRVRTQTSATRLR